MSHLSTVWVVLLRKGKRYLHRSLSDLRLLAIPSLRFLLQKSIRTNKELFYIVQPNCSTRVAHFIKAMRTCVTGSINSMNQPCNAYL